MNIQQGYINTLKDSIQILNGVHSVLINTSSKDEHHLEIRVVVNRIEEELWSNITTIVEQQEKELRNNTNDIWLFDVVPVYP